MFASDSTSTPPIPFHCWSKPSICLACQWWGRWGEGGWWRLLLQQLMPTSRREVISRKDNVKFSSTTRIDTLLERLVEGDIEGDIAVTVVVGFVVIQKQRYHGNMTSHFSFLYRKPPCPPPCDHKVLNVLRTNTSKSFQKLLLVFSLKTLITQNNKLSQPH